MIRLWKRYTVPERVSLVLSTAILVYLVVSIVLGFAGVELPNAMGWIVPGLILVAVALRLVGQGSRTRNAQENDPNRR